MKPEITEAAGGTKLAARVYRPGAARRGSVGLWPRMAGWLADLAGPAAA